MITIYYDVILDEYYYQYKDLYFFDTRKDVWKPGHVKLTSSIIKTQDIREIDITLAASYLKMYNDIPIRKIRRYFMPLCFTHTIKK